MFIESYFLSMLCERVRQDLGNQIFILIVEEGTMVEYLIVEEGTMVVVCMKLCGCDVVPFIGHGLFDFLLCEWTLFSDCFLPIVKYGVVERRESLG